MTRTELPIYGLTEYGKDWAPNVYFTKSRDRGEFLRLADWLIAEFRAEVVERFGGEEADSKEYWTLRVEGSDWLLMRCYYPVGISLAGRSLRDLPAFEVIARTVGATPVGWRYRWVQFRRRLAGIGRRPRGV